MAVVNQRVDHHTHYNHTTLELHNTEVHRWITEGICGEVFQTAAVFSLSMNDAGKIHAQSSQR